MCFLCFLFLPPSLFDSLSTCFQNCLTNRLYYYEQHNEHIEVQKLNNLIQVVEQHFANMPSDAEGQQKALIDEIVTHYDNTYKHIQAKKKEAKASDDPEERARWANVLEDGADDGDEEEGDYDEDEDEDAPEQD